MCNNVNITDEVESKINELIKRVIPKRLRDIELSLDLNIKTDLHIDSLALAELIILIDKELGVDLFGKNVTFSTIQSILDKVKEIKATCKEGER